MPSAQKPSEERRIEAAGSTECRSTSSAKLRDKSGKVPGVYPPNNGNSLRRKAKMYRRRRPKRKYGTAESVRRGGKRYWTKRGLFGQPRSAPSIVPTAKARTVVVTRSPIVQGRDSASTSLTRRG
jgi:hypothetical protein